MNIFLMRINLIYSQKCIIILENFRVEECLTLEGLYRIGWFLCVLCEVDPLFDRPTFDVNLFNDLVLSFLNAWLFGWITSFLVAFSSLNNNFLRNHSARVSHQLESIKFGIGFVSTDQAEAIPRVEVLDSIFILTFLIGLSEAEVLKITSLCPDRDVLVPIFGVRQVPIRLLMDEIELHILVQIVISELGIQIQDGLLSIGVSQDPEVQSLTIYIVDFPVLIKINLLSSRRSFISFFQYQGLESRKDVVIYGHVDDHAEETADEGLMRRSISIKIQLNSVAKSILRLNVFAHLIYIFISNK